MSTPVVRVRVDTKGRTLDGSSAQHFTELFRTVAKKRAKEAQR